jgi:hypothetical protein
MRTTLAFLVACSALLQACAVNPPPSHVQVRDDNFAPYREMATGSVESGNGLSLESLQLFARIDRTTGALSTFVKVTHVYKAALKVFFESARNTRAEPLKLTPLGRTSKCNPKTGCIYTEVYQIDIPETELRQAGPAGYPFKVFARVAGERTLTIPKALVDSLLHKIEIDRQQHPQQVAKR